MGGNYAATSFGVNLPRPSSPVRQDGERRTTFLDEYAFRRVPYSYFGSFFFVLTSDFQFIDAIINNARCACHPLTDLAKV